MRLEAPFPVPFPLEEPGIGLVEGLLGGERCMKNGRMDGYLSRVVLMYK